MPPKKSHPKIGADIGAITGILLSYKVVYQSAVSQRVYHLMKIETGFWLHILNFVRAK